MLSNRSIFSTIAIASLLSTVFSPYTAFANTCTGFDGGTGSSGDPYQITNVSQFKAMENCVSTYEHFKIMNDINFDSDANWDGLGIAIFTGVLDGNNKTLSRVTISQAIPNVVGSESAQTLFGEVAGTSANPAIIKNLKFNGLKISTEAGNPSYTGLIGFSTRAVELQNIEVVASENLVSADFASLLVARAFERVDFDGVYVQGKLNAGEAGGASGGLVGELIMSNNITSTISKARVDVEFTGLSSSTFSHQGGAIGEVGSNIGQVGSNPPATTLNIEDLAVNISGPNGLTGNLFGGVFGAARVPYIAQAPRTVKINVSRVSVLGEIPQAQSNSFLAGELQRSSAESLSLNLQEAVFAGSSKTASNRGLYFGALSTDAPTVNVSDVFHDTDLVETTHFPSAADVTKITSADRSEISSYPSLSVTDNLSISDDWYLQAEDNQGELFGGYPVPFAVANTTYFGPRYFFRANGAPGPDIGRIGAGAGSFLEVIANPFDRTGFGFKGWNNTAKGSGDYFPVGDPVRGLDGGSIFAIWNEFYDTTFDSNNADRGSVAPIIDNNSITVPGPGDLERNGFEFIGWNTQANGEGTAYSKGDTLNLDSNMTLFAQWQKTQLASAPRPYSGPLITSVGTDSAINAESTGTIRVSGERLSTVSGVLVDGKEGTVISVATDHFIMTLPEGLASGTYDLVVLSSLGSVTYQEGITVGAQTEEVSSNTYGQVSAWTRKISDTEAKVYVKYPTVGEKVEIQHQTGGSGEYENIYSRTTTSEEMDGLRFVEGVGSYLVRTIQLADINRIRVTVGDQQMVQVRYNN